MVSSGVVWLHARAASSDISWAFDGEEPSRAEAMKLTMQIDAKERRGLAMMTTGD
jgi:hypothetical protein